MWHGTRLLIDLKRDFMRVSVLEGENPVPFLVRGEPYQVTPGHDAMIPLHGQGPVLAGSPRQSAGRHRREDGTLMIPQVPTVTGVIPITTQVPVMNESSEADDALR
jgi:alpha,alpha-trehalose phosphorylase